MSLAARMNRPQAAEASAPPVEMRLTPRSSSSRLVNPGQPTSTLTGRFPGDTHDLGDFFGRSHERRVKNVGAGFRVGGETPQRLGKPAGLTQDRFAPRGEKHLLAARVDGGARSP